MTTGEVLRVRAAMKPISTVPRALATVDVATGEPAVAINQRSDACAVPRGRSSWRRWWRSCSPTPRWRSSAATRWPRPAATRGPTSTPCRSGEPARSWCWSGRRRRARPPSARPLAGALGVAFRDTDPDIEAAAGSTRRRDLRRRRASRTSAPWSGRRSPRALAEHDGVLALGGGAVTPPATRELLVATAARAAPWCG